jgi:arylsulfatase
VKVPLDNGPDGTPGHANFPADADPLDPKAYAPFIGRTLKRPHDRRGRGLHRRPQGQAFLSCYYASPLPHVALQVPAEELKPYEGVIKEDAPYAPKKGGYSPNRTPARPTRR